MSEKGTVSLMRQGISLQDCRSNNEHVCSRCAHPALFAIHDLPITVAQEVYLPINGWVGVWRTIIVYSSVSL